MDVPPLAYVTDGMQALAPTVRRALTAAVLTMAALIPTILRAKPAAGAVDLALVLAVDVSPSMNRREQDVQRKGYIAAFRHPDLARAIAGGLHSQIAVAYVEWAGVDFQRVVIPWTIIADGRDASRFADTLAKLPIQQAPATSISGALRFAGELLQSVPFQPSRRVVDVSGNGANNSGPAVAPVRDALVRAGITINGLPIMALPPPAAPSRFHVYSMTYLRPYFESCVTGGPGSFVMEIYDLSQFDEAIRRKLIREIAGLPSMLKGAFIPAQYAKLC